MLRVLPGSIMFPAIALLCAEVCQQAINIPIPFWQDVGICRYIYVAHGWSERPTLDLHNNNPPVSINCGSLGRFTVGRSFVIKKIQCWYKVQGEARWLFRVSWFATWYRSSSTSSMNVIFKEVLYLIMSLEQAPCKLKHADTSATGRERCCDMLLNSLLAVIDAWNRYDMGVSEYSSSTTEITYRCLELWGTLCSPYLWVHQHSKISMVRLPSDGLEVGMWTTWSLAIGTMEHHHGSFGLPLCKLRAQTHCRWLFGRPIMEDEVGSVLI